MFSHIHLGYRRNVAWLVMVLVCMFGVYKWPADGKAEEATKVSAIQTVIAEGVGTTADEALKDAFRSAVRQVVGALVDAETLVKDEEVVSDKVLTFSNGFVKQYEEIGKKEVKGLFRVKIKAQVERKGVVDKLKAANVKVKDIDGKSLFAEAMTDLEREKDAQAILKKTLEGFPLNCMTVSVSGEPKIVERDGDNATVSVTIQVEPNMEAYKVFVKKLDSVLEKIEEDKNSKGNFVVKSKKMTEESKTDYRHNFMGMMAYDNNLKINNEEYNEIKMLCQGWMPKFIKCENHFTEFNILPKNKCAIAICKQKTNNYDRIEYKYFIIDKSVKNLFLEKSFIRYQAKVVFEDENENVLFTDKFDADQNDMYDKGKNYDGTLIAPIFFNDGSMHFFIGNKKGVMEKLDIKNEVIFFVSPMFLNFGEDYHNSSRMFEYLPKLNIEQKVKLSLGEIKNIKKVKVELDEK